MSKNVLQLCPKSACKKQSREFGFAVWYVGSAICNYICETPDGYKLFDVDVDIVCNDIGQSTNEDFRFLNLEPIRVCCNSISNFTSINNILGDEFRIKYITKLDGTAISNSIYGNGMSLRKDKDHLMLGRYHDISGNWGAFQNNVIPPLRLGFQGKIVCI